ncbi:nucleotidyltransferase family protein [Cryobacterium melibiosiphilum]|uniref:Nucleotidyltransferase family protein n=1 Tax=Cryobacterium melibiosiphilum TaxID=995039 RepID=A0A3A5MGJ5_9MICO|nr:nucleotidyltransferase family protein [Cryobacterium melibiosiphilum]RJT88225.1 nucleotidyltransferase family protein [Cryobacterium melibiosiphilum]
MTDSTSDAPASAVAGLVLAAGGGTRYGSPKAVVRGADGISWLLHAVQTLAASGCSPVLVVLGAAADEAEALVAGALVAGALTTPVILVRAPDWAEGLSASLRAGLNAAGRLADSTRAIAVIPVDVPDLDLATVARVLNERETALTPDTLRQAVFGGRPGHPVLIGRAHWAPLAAGLTGDRGARPYLVAHDAQPVECADLSSGVDVDTPAPPVPRAR